MLGASREKDNNSNVNTTKLFQTWLKQSYAGQKEYIKIRNQKDEIINFFNRKK